MDALRQRLRDFNARSPNTTDHFKLVTHHPDSGGDRATHEVRLCSCHPRLITCIADDTSIRILSKGPTALRMSVAHDHDSLQKLLTLLHDHRDDTHTLLDWELEDWVGAGYPCRMHSEHEFPLFPDLGFMPEDLWCVDEMPRYKAHISNIHG